MSETASNTEVELTADAQKEEEYAPDDDELANLLKELASLTFETAAAEAIPEPSARTSDEEVSPWQRYSYENCASSFLFQTSPSDASLKAQHTALPLSQ
jgi:molecular chaperone GrpE (heat shock protein)